MFKNIYPGIWDVRGVDDDFSWSLQRKCAFFRARKKRRPLALEALTNPQEWPNARRKDLYAVAPLWVKLLDWQNTIDQHALFIVGPGLSWLFSSQWYPEEYQSDAYDYRTHMRQRMGEGVLSPAGIFAAVGQFRRPEEYTQYELSQMAYETQAIDRDMYKTTVTQSITPRLAALSYIINTFHINSDAPTVVHWYEQSGDTPIRDLKLKSARVSKFLRMLVQKYEYNFTDQQIQEASEWCGENLRTPKFTMRVVSGDNISATYREEYFGSCMHESSAPEFYDYQDNVSLLRIENGDELVGRALIWENVRDVHNQKYTVLDRVYPSDGGAHIQAAMDWAEKQGWIYKIEHRIDGALSSNKTLYVDVKDTGNYPYMDTFGWSDAPDDGYTTLDNVGRGGFEWRSTDNIAPWEDDMIECPNCGRQQHADNMVYVESTDECVCGRCAENNYTYCEDEGMLISNDDIVEIVNSTDMSYVGRDHNYLVEMDDGNFAIYDVYRRYTRLDWTPIELDNGDWTHPENAVEIDGCWYHRENDAELIAKLLAEKEEED